ncbi:hypothetical protein [uncultured Boseongicola sp.]|uniref:hypothetical protein n=1 Tax=uncultured Boseongicola sp. TaxID=1648499 RepID=UPI00261C897A|nr:hypothetical protein [uncultured Boseongicola sp.]
MLYLGAFAITIIGSQGLFNVAPDGMAVVWPLFLGLPWSIYLSVLTTFGGQF